MVEFDAIDEAIINAEPDIVYKALLAEYAGKTNWWLPHLEAKVREGSTPDKLDALVEITVHDRIPIRFTTKTVEAKKNELWRSQYVEGYFRGEGVWKFEAVGGNTKVSYHWHTYSAGLLLRIVTTFVNIPKSHSNVMKAGFTALNEHVKKQDRSYSFERLFSRTIFYNYVRKKLADVRGAVYTFTGVTLHNIYSAAIHIKDVNFQVDILILVGI